MDYATPYDGTQYAYPLQYPYPAQPVYTQQQYENTPYAPQPAYTPQPVYPPQYDAYAQQYDAYAQQPAYAPQYSNPYAPQVPQPVYPPQPAAPEAYAAGDDAAWNAMDLGALPAQAVQAVQPAQPCASPSDAPPQALPEKNKKSKFKDFFNRKEKPETTGKKVLRFATNLAFWAVCIALVGGSLLFVLNNDPNKNYFGYRAYGVRSNSMAPNEDGTSPAGGFYKGDTIIVQMCQPQQVKEGDIVTFCPNPNDPESTAYLTHRVVKVLDELGGKQGIYFVTKGDHNKSEDPPIAGNAIIGKKVASVPKMGAVLELIRANLVVSVIVIVGLFGTILMLQWYFTKPAEQPQKKARKSKKQPAAGPAPVPVFPMQQQAAFYPMQSVLPG